jgi:hypothetical protein
VGQGVVEHCISKRRPKEEKRDDDLLSQLLLAVQFNAQAVGGLQRE